MRTPPHEILPALRAKSNTDQMAVFAEALIERNENARFLDLPYIAAAYMLGRVDALAPEATEVNGSAGPMALAALMARGLVFSPDRMAHVHDDLPF
jgi:hypothetical protein